MNGLNSANFTAIKEIQSRWSSYLSSRFFSRYCSILSIEDDSNVGTSKVVRSNLCFIINSVKVPKQAIFSLGFILKDGSKVVAKGVSWGISSEDGYNVKILLKRKKSKHFVWSEMALDSAQL